MEKRWRYVIGAIFIPCLIGGVSLLDSHPNWARALFAIGGVSVLWGIWPFLSNVSQRAVETLRDGVSLDISPEATIADLDQLYDTVRKVVRRKDEIAETVGRCSYQDYIPYYSGQEQFKKLVEKWGESGAVIEELNLSLFNPLLDDRLRSDKLLPNAEDTVSSLTGKVGNERLRSEIEKLFSLQYEGHRNWVDGDLGEMLESKANSQVIKKRYNEMVSSQLGKVLGIVNELRKQVSNNTRKG